MPKYILPLDELEPNDFKIAGGKAVLIRWLNLQNFPVPDALIITSNVFESILTGHKDISRYIKCIKGKSTEEAAPFLQKLRDSFVKLKFPKPLEKMLFNGLGALHFPHFCNVVVRSSPIIVNKPEEYISGLGNSILNINNYCSVVEAIKTVWASFWSEKFYKFRKLNFPESEKFSLALLVQKMCKVDYSGIVSSPTKYRNDLIKIDVSMGIPEGIKRKQIHYDTYTLKSEIDSKGTINFETIEENITDKDKMLVFKNQEKVLLDVPLEKALIPVIENQEKQEICRLTLKIQDFLKKPVIITWGQGKELYIIGLRILEECSGEDPKWVLSQISNFSGEIPSPLCNSLVMKYIEQEFNFLSKILGINNISIKGSIKEIWGRPYYNGNLNKYLWKILGIPEGFLGRHLKGKPIFCKNDNKEKIDNCLSFNLKIAGNINKQFTELLKSSTNNLNLINSFNKEMQNISFDKLDKVSIKNILLKFFTNIVNKGITGIIPAGINYCLGIMAKLKQVKNNPEFYNLIPDASLNFEVSYINDIIALLNEIEKSKEINKIFSLPKVDASDLIPVKYSSFMKCFKSFLNKYEYISPYPLDLYSASINDDPTFILALLWNLRRSEMSPYFSKKCLEPIPLEPLQNKQKKSKGFLVKLLCKKPRPEDFEKNIIKLMDLESKNNKILIQNIYFYKKILFSIGKIFVKDSILDFPEDIFMLKVEEIFKVLKETISLKKIVLERKKQTNYWNQYPLHYFFLGTGINTFPFENTKTEILNNAIQGIPICSGNPRGKIFKVNLLKDFLKIGPDNIPMVKNITISMLPFIINMPGIIIENVGLSFKNIALIRKLNIPAIGGFPEIFNLLKNNTTVQIDGNKGTLQII